MLESKHRSSYFQGKHCTEPLVSSVPVMTLHGNFGVRGRCQGPRVCQVTSPLLLKCICGSLHSRYHGLSCHMRKLQSDEVPVLMPGSERTKTQSQSNPVAKLCQFSTSLLYCRMDGWMDTLSVEFGSSLGRGEVQVLSCPCPVRLVLGTKVNGQEQISLSSQDGSGFGQRRGGGGGGWWGGEGACSYGM